MAGSRSSGQVRGVPWNPRTFGDPCELTTLAELRCRFPPEVLRRRELLSFDVVVMVESGQGTHEVDLHDLVIGPRSVLHLTRGQLHLWPESDEVNATLLLCPTVPAGADAWRPTPRAHHLSERNWAPLQEALDLLRHEIRATRSPLARHTSLTALRDLVFVMAGLLPDSATRGADDQFSVFRNDVETHLVTGQSIEQRAERLGFSARTVDRACRAHTGISAKQFVDQRLVLEARRLLSLPGMTIAAVGHQLGFDEPTNFTKFIRRRTGRTPTMLVAQRDHKSGQSPVGSRP